MNDPRTPGAGASAKQIEEIKRMYEEFLVELRELRKHQTEEMHQLTQKLVERKLAEVTKKIQSLSQ